MLIEPEQLRDRLGEVGLAIVDCRFSLADPAWGEAAYGEAHLPGAVYLHLERDLSGPVGQHGGRHPLPDPAVLAAKLGAVGIGPDTDVVIYDSARFGFGARLWWLLGWLGHDRASLLNGGWAGWQAISGPTTAASPTPTPTTLPVNLRPDWVVDRATLLGKLPEFADPQRKTVLLDAREPARYRGEVEPIDPVAGSIPGASNWFWQSVTDASGRAIAPEDLAALAAPILGPAEQSIAYCGSGVTACVLVWALAFALRSHSPRLGGSPARLYAGSWSDWCSYADAPVARFATPAS